MRRKILIVDDDPALALLIKLRLESNGFDTITAANGADGLQSAFAFHPDLILLDVRMPRVDGWTFIKQLHHSDLGRRIPVIVTTSQEKLDDLFTLEGVAGFVRKPYDATNLIGKIREVLDA